ncbi:effector-associated constant component EACC1 [Streptomyces anulatus]|uniref:effector-associated constant component EACC1 n=1 Tax=Streptomyces anulatus TaxID=1892 RepID=UPI00362F61C0
MGPILAHPPARHPRATGRGREPLFGNPYPGVSYGVSRREHGAVAENGRASSQGGRTGDGEDQVQLEVRVASTGELRSLQGWLRSDPEVRRSATADVRGSAPRPGEMGTTLDVLQLVTENGWSAASFVLALVAWRRTRPQPPRLEIRRGDTVVVLTDGSDEEIERVIRALGADRDEDGGQ